jgi:hypothetical protein
MNTIISNRTLRVPLQNGMSLAAALCTGASMLPELVSVEVERQKERARKEPVASSASPQTTTENRASSPKETSTSSEEEETDGLALMRARALKSFTARMKDSSVPLEQRIAFAEKIGYRVEVKYYGKKVKRVVMAHPDGDRIEFRP